MHTCMCEHAHAIKGHFSESGNLEKISYNSFKEFYWKKRKPVFLQSQKKFQIKKHKTYVFCNLTMKDVENE